MEKLGVYRKPPIDSIKDIPSFVEDDYSFRYFQKPQLFHLISLAERIGWRDAVASYQSSSLIRYLTDPQRLLLMPLLSLISNSKILDLGAGLGSLSFPIAKRNPSCQVYAFDKTLDGLLLLNIIKEQEKLWNLHIARADALDIPLDDSFFDLVLMVGILEWVGNSTVGMKPMEAQKTALQETYRVLKSGGQLLVGIENRLGHQFLRGHPDHSGLSYTSLMPRYIANLYTKIRLGFPYKTYTYSERGYRKLLTETGFTDVRFFTAIPDYRFPELILEVNSVKEVLRNKKTSLLTKLALRCMPYSLVRLFVPSYLIVAVK